MPMIRSRWGAWLLAACWLAAQAQATVYTVQQGGPISTLGAALAQVQDNDTINVVAGPADYVEGALTAGRNNLTIQGTSGTPHFARTRLLVLGTGLILRNLQIDGQRDLDMTNLVQLVSAHGALIESCTIINPASGTGTGSIGTVSAQGSASLWSSPGACVRITSSNNVTLRNCVFECTRADAILNEVNVFSYSAVGPQSNLLIETCRFQAQTKNILLMDNHDNATIRDNQFNRTAAPGGNRLTLDALATAAICLIPGDPSIPTAYNRVVISGNRFNGVAGAGIVFFNGTTGGGRVSGNSFDQCYADNLVVKTGGDALEVSGNAFKMVRSANSSGTVIETALPDLVARDGMLPALAVVNNHFLDANGNYIYVRDGAMVMRVEGNVFESNPTYAYYAGGNDTELQFVDNVVNGGGSAAGTQGCLALAGDNELVKGNLIKNHDGAVVFVRWGLPGTPQQANPGGRTVVADNIITQMLFYGIRERNDYTAIDGRDEYFDGNRYFNNTLVLVNGTAIEVHNDRVDVFNNLILQNQGGIQVSDAVLGVLDWNLVFANGTGGSGNYLGLAVAGAHDVHANPLLADIPGGDFSLLPGSPARNAGTNPVGNLLEPDYATEIGAVQDTQINTPVPRSGWELYR